MKKLDYEIVKTEKTYEIVVKLSKLQVAVLKKTFKKLSPEEFQEYLLSNIDMSMVEKNQVNFDDLDKLSFTILFG